MHQISDKDIIQIDREAVSTSTKTFVIDQAMILNYMQIEYTSTSTVGNRQLRIGLLDPNDNVLIDFHSGAVQAASQDYHYSAIPGIFREASFIDDSIQVPVPRHFIFLVGYKLKIWDNGPAGTPIDVVDTMVISWQGTKLKQLK